MVSNVNKEKEYCRSDNILRRKFVEYLFPMFITLTALSLNEFVDSLLVSRLLGSRGMAIVTLGSPVMLAMAVIYILFGSGGSTVYAICLGERKREKAGKAFTCSMFMAACTGIGMLVACSIFFKSISGILCTDAALRDSFDRYFHILILSAPMLVITLTLAQFLPAAGLPKYATAVNVVANVVNIIMDYVYIHGFGMDVEGAAWATLTGYACGILVIVYALARKKLKVCVSRDLLSSFGVLPEIIKQGSADVMSQAGFAIQIAVCNSLATSYSGPDGVVAYGLYLQALSVSSIFMGALIGAYTPLIALLHGQRDYRGEADMLKLVLKTVVVVSLICSAVYILFAPQAAALYSITEEGQAALAIRAFRVFAIYLFLRGIVIVYFRYLKVVGLTGYAVLTGALDGFLSLVPIVFIMTRLIGVDGIWWGYTVNISLLLIFMIVVNLRIMRRSKGKFYGILLLEKETEHEILMDVSITKDLSDIAGISEKLQQICEDHGLDRKDAMRAGLVVEEIAVYAANQKNQSSYMDVLVRLCEGHIEIDFRSLGEDFDTLDKIGEEMELNIKLLRGLSKSMTTEYAMGMNLSHITLDFGTKRSQNSMAASPPDCPRRGLMPPS